MTEKNKKPRTRQQQINGLYFDDTWVKGMQIATRLYFERELAEAEERGAERNAEEEKKKWQASIAWQVQQEDGAWVWTSVPWQHEAEGRPIRPHGPFPEDIAAIVAESVRLERERCASVCFGKAEEILRERGEEDTDDDCNMVLSGADEELHDELISLGKLIREGKSS
ncbi:hypothetical protein [Asaia astilbis]|uniref:hypothetical protein n=1 Tax=Asaia astilbis TaxID=610244 RepID=UPI00046E7970|nr:hypothetical protein [Asaia astilbis]